MAAPPETVAGGLAELANRYRLNRDDGTKEFLRSFRMWLGQQRYSSKLMAWQLPADENMPKSGAFMKEMQFLMRQGV